jgi:hypothetical protein
MEKLVYVLWSSDGRSSAEFAAGVRGVAAAIDRAADSKVFLNLVDQHVDDALGVRLTHLEPPPAGVLTFWLDSSDDRAPIEAALTACTDRFAGYLVVESVPLLNNTRPASPGQRTSGINMIALIERPARMSNEKWIEHWHGHHKRVALETQCTYAYVRNVVVRALTSDAPDWAGIVEEGFPAEAVTDPMLWYKAEGSAEKLQTNMGRMIESVQAFLDIDRVESHPMSEYRVQ